jgi:hypothetical protein
LPFAWSVARWTSSVFSVSAQGPRLDRRVELALAVGHEGVDDDLQRDVVELTANALWYPAAQ